MLSHDLARELLARRNNDVRIQVITDADDEAYETQMIELRDQHDLQADAVVTYDPTGDVIVIRAGWVATDKAGDQP